MIKGTKQRKPRPQSDSQQMCPSKLHASASIFGQHQEDTHSETLLLRSSMRERDESRPQEKPESKPDLP